ncbi:hypothetical protein BpHYR1_022242 [Brachionus plicatilis]|uniref:Uncharacterized protein n=1 Tax=Brachionus plicatilis TaxID=10195 RepID=A0A3M7T5Z6_BRAPC|nr:hypothetical protein BpHYR1_022242 [Brachionus plicatilis]
MPPKSKYIRSRIKINLKIKRLFNISFSNKNSTNCDIREISIGNMYLITTEDKVWSGYWSILRNSVNLIEPMSKTIKGEKTFGYFYSVLYGQSTRIWVYMEAYIYNF